MSRGGSTKAGSRRSRCARFSPVLPRCRCGVLTLLCDTTGRLLVRPDWELVSTREWPLHIEPGDRG